MPSGGARTGSGRKPKTTKALPFIPGGRAGDFSAEIPEDLPEDQAEFWRKYAKTAIAARTLSDQTVGAFRLLCELDAEKRATKETIDKDGRTYIKVVVDGAGNEHQELKAHPLKSDYAKLAKQVETLMARFSLAPFGKPIADTKPRAAASNPWARIVGQTPGG